MQLKYRLYRRNNGTFYWQENNGLKQGSLKTKDKREATALLHAMNEAHRQPTLTLSGDLGGDLEAHFVGKPAGISEMQVAGRLSAQ